MRIRLAASVFVISLILPGLTASSEEEAPFARAERLRAEGRSLEAIRAFLEIPGAEHHAAAIARKAKEDLLAETEALLEEAPDALARRRVLLVRGDVLLAHGKRDAALSTYRDIAASLPSAPEMPIEIALTESNAYPVELSPDPHGHSRGTVLPFWRGPGSHRDNWILRRFLALQAWDDAEREFRRIQSWHRGVAGEGPWSTIGLQFSVDFAFFLKHRGRVENAHVALLEPLRRIDLDHAPRARPGAGGFAPWSQRYYAGISRKEYVRLVLGEFRTSDSEAMVLQALQEQIADGRNEARRVRARAHLLAGRVDEAVADELDYIETAGFDAPSAAIRRGRVHEEVHRLREAIAAYEEALLFPAGEVDLPDPDEDIGSHGAAAGFRLSERSSAERVRGDLLHRLERLHGSLGDAATSLGYALRALDGDRSEQRQLDRLESHLRRFQVGGQEAAFRQWLEALVESAPEPVIRANAAWMLGDETVAMQHVVAARAYLGEQGLRRWMDRARKHGEGTLRALLTALIEADPSLGRARLELLVLDGTLDSAAAISLYDGLLDGSVRCEFDAARGDWEPLKLTGWGDVAYRLMRIHRLEAHADACVSLGVRIAKVAEPFHASLLNPNSSADGRSEPQLLRAALVHAIQAATTADHLEALAAALVDSPWSGVRRQLERRRAPASPEADPAPEFGWAHAPEGVRLLASNEDVLCLAHDAGHVYAGHPWGVAVYDLAGRPVTRVWLASAALALAAGEDALWVGTPLGVFRVDGADRSVMRLRGDQDLNPRREIDDRSRYRDHAATALLLRDSKLWIGTRRDVRAYDTTTGDLRIYSTDETQTLSGHDWFRFFVDGEDLWAEGDQGARVYDPKHDTWVAPTTREGRGRVRILGRAAGNLWGSVHLGRDLGNRPCRLERLEFSGLDRFAVHVDPLPLDPSVRDRHVIGSRALSLYGTLNGQPVFGDEAPALVLDPDTGTLHSLAVDEHDRPLPVELEDALPVGLRWAVIRLHASGEFRGDPQSGDGRNLHGEFSASRWSALRLPDGTLVLGGRTNRQRHVYPVEDWPPQGAHPREEAPETGGLWIFPPNAAGRRVSTLASLDGLPSDRVLAVTTDPGGDGLWLATQAGIARVDAEGRVRARFGGAAGLVGNRFDAACSLRGLVYFGSSWDDQGGGLTVYDPATRVFTSLHPADGLATNRIRRLEAVDGRLRIHYGLQYRRWTNVYDYQRHRPSLYDPETGRFESGGEVERFDREQAGGPPRPTRTAPWLGGFVTDELTLEGARILATTHGVSLRQEGASEPAAFAELPARLLPDQLFELRRRAERVSLPDSRSPRILETARHPNPYVRARALWILGVHRVPDVPLELVSDSLEDEYAFVRRNAARWLGRTARADVRALLERARRDPDEVVRFHAALGLARRGDPADLSLLERHFRGAGDSYASEGKAVYEALADHVDPRVARFLLRYPPPVSEYEPWPKILDRMGTSASKTPECVELFLQARLKEGGGDSVGFAQAALAAAGPMLLPRLYEALQSPDRVVRSNAARALGRMGIAESIEPLIASLPLESGLSRASIVWALGALKAREALPHLVKLYVDARADDQRRQGAGWRIGQAAAAARGVYTTLASLDAVGRDWSELDVARRDAEPVDVRREPLLTPRGVLEAVAAIGPEAAQAFYRTLAGERDARAREEAARRLSECGAADREANVIVLRTLRAGEPERVRIAATVSLLVLGRRDEVDGSLREWLASRGTDAMSATLGHLGRVGDTAVLEPYGDLIMRIADDVDVADSWRANANRLLQRLGMRR